MGEKNYVIRVRGFLLLFFQISIVLGSFIYIFWGIQFEGILASLNRWNPLGLVLAFGIMFVDICLMIFRLYTLFLKKITVRTAIYGVIFCLGYNNILPAKAGDIIKTVFIHKENLLPFSFVIPIIVWERIFDSVILFLLLLISFSNIALGGILFLFFFVVVFFFILRRYAQFFYQLYERIPIIRLAYFLHELHENGIEKVTLSWLFSNLFLTIAIWGSYFGCFWVSMHYMAGLDLTLFQMILVFVVTCTGAALPSTPGSLGVFEAGMVLSLSLYGIERDVALPVALFIHFLYFLPITLGALFLSLLEFSRKKIGW